MIPLWIQIGFFIWRLPARLDTAPLDQLLAQIHAAPRRRPAAAFRIATIRRRWLRLPFWSSRNTCYVRALVLFRFLNPADGDLRFHLGTEPPRIPHTNIHGHAWVTLNGTPVEPLPDPIASRISLLYTFPPTAPNPSRLPQLQGLPKCPPPQP